MVYAKFAASQAVNSALLLVLSVYHAKTSITNQDQPALCANLWTLGAFPAVP